MRMPDQVIIRAAQSGFLFRKFRQNLFQMDPSFLIIFVICVAVVIRLLAGSFDGERVEQYIRAMGGELVDRSWDPFGPGWFGEKDSRIYQIVYRDRDGLLHRAHVKTSLMTGVYLTNDQLIDDAEPEPIEAEKERLRRRLAELDQMSQDR